MCSLSIMKSIGNNIFFIVCMLGYQQMVYAEVVYPDPNFATEIDSITVYFDATEGDQGLMDYTDDIWAHTGVITSNSTHSTCLLYTSPSPRD